MATIAIICPVWNSIDWTELFLRNVARLYKNNDDVVVVIVNNGSNDGTDELLSKAEWVHVISNDKNSGYAAACNQGAEFARELTGDDVQLVIMNNDVSIVGDFVTILRRAMAQSPGALYGATLHTHDTGWNQFNGEIIKYLEGWLLAMTWEVYKDIGGFDERFSPCDYEDIDFSYKATILGRKLIALNLPIQHIGNQTGKLLDDRREITERNKIKFARKWGFQNG